MINSTEYWSLIWFGKNLQIWGKIDQKSRTLSSFGSLTVSIFKTMHTFLLLLFFSFKISNKSKKQVFFWGGGGGVLVLILLHHVIKRFVQRIKEKCRVELHVPVPITINQLQNERLSSWCMGVCIGMQRSAQNQMRVPTQQAQHANKIGSL